MCEAFRYMALKRQHRGAQQANCCLRGPASKLLPMAPSKHTAASHQRCFLTLYSWSANWPARSSRGRCILHSSVTLWATTCT